MRRQAPRLGDPTAARATKGKFTQELEDALARVLDAMPEERVDILIAVLAFGVPVPDLARWQGREPAVIHREVGMSIARIQHPSRHQLWQLFSEFLDFVSAADPLTALPLVLQRIGVDPAAISCLHCGVALYQKGWKGYLSDGQLHALAYLWGREWNAPETTATGRGLRQGRPVRYCSAACRQAAYRQRIRARRTASEG